MHVDPSQSTSCLSRCDNQAEKAVKREGGPRPKRKCGPPQGFNGYLGTLAASIVCRYNHVAPGPRLKISYRKKRLCAGWCFGPGKSRMRVFSDFSFC